MDGKHHYRKRRSGNRAAPCISTYGQISSNQARAYVHALRDKADLMLIGGNTVRIDKPTLRDIGSNHMVYANDKEFAVLKAEYDKNNVKKVKSIGDSK